jgi:hypothetical protein
MLSSGSIICWFSEWNFCNMCGIFVTEVGVLGFRLDFLLSLLSIGWSFLQLNCYFVSEWGQVLLILHKIEIFLRSNYYLYIIVLDVDLYW